MGRGFSFAIDGPLDATLAPEGPLVFLFQYRLAEHERALPWRLPSAWPSELLANCKAACAKALIQTKSPSVASRPDKRHVLYRGKPFEDRTEAASPSSKILGWRFSIRPSKPSAIDCCHCLGSRSLPEVASPTNANPIRQLIQPWIACSATARNDPHVATR